MNLLTTIFSNFIIIRSVLGCALSMILLGNTIYQLYQGKIRMKIYSKKSLMIVTHSLALIGNIFKK